jgi:hypothetical protein
VTPNEVLDLLETVAGYTPGMRVADASAAVWHHQLRHVPAAEAHAAVHAHFATETRWVMPADVRRRVAAARGLLPPDPEAAYAQAVAMNRWLALRSGPEPRTHPAVMAACRTVGWSTLDAPDGVAHQRFVDAYRPAAAAAVERAAAAGPAEVEADLRASKALPGGSGARPAETSGRVPARPDPARLAELRRRLARVAAAAAPPAPRPDYPPPTEAERDRWSAALRAWAEANGHPLGGPA